MIFVKASQLLESVSTGHRRDMIDIGFRRHRRHRRVDVAIVELLRSVIVPERAQIVARAESMPQQSNRARTRELRRKWIERFAPIIVESMTGVGVDVELGAIM